MSLTPGRSKDGRDIDLCRLLDQVSTNIDTFQKLADTFIQEHPEWQEIAQRAAHMYFHDLANIEPMPSSYETARQLGLSVNDVSRANSISIVILFGLSHYLQWSGFDIKNPTDFEEVSTRLAFTRNVLALMGFRMALDQKAKLKVSSDQLKKCYQEGFLLGMALGYLVADAHSLRPTVSAPFLSAELD